MASGVAQVASVGVVAAAPVVSSYDEWIEAMNSSVSDFARTLMREDILAEAATGDYYAREQVAHEAQYSVRLEALSDAALVAELRELDAKRARIREDEDESELTWEDFEEISHREWMIFELQIWRQVQARYTGLPPLAYRPFVGLVAAQRPPRGPRGY